MLEELRIGAGTASGERRRRYDMFGPEGVAPGAGGPGAGDAFGFGLNDLFDAFFGGRDPFGGDRQSAPGSRVCASPGSDREDIAAVIKSRTRDEWAAHFAGTDACVAPVLDLEEA